MRKDIVSTAKLEFRLTPEEKEKIKAYCKQHNLTMSEFARIACEKIFNQEEK